MESKYLICNFKDCFKELTDEAYVTFCSHIFCVDHGEKLKTSPSKLCFACKKELLEHQIVETKLNMSSDSYKIFLVGQNPKTILDITLNALSFWLYQKKHEISIVKRREEKYKLKLQSQAKIAEEAMKEKDLRINNCLKEVEKLKEERAALKAEIATLTENVILAKKAKVENIF